MVDVGQKWLDKRTGDRVKVIEVNQYGVRFELETGRLSSGWEPMATWLDHFERPEGLLKKDLRALREEVAAQLSDARISLAYCLFGGGQHVEREVLVLERVLGRIDRILQ